MKRRGFLGTAAAAGAAGVGRISGVAPTPPPTPSPYIGGLGDATQEAGKILGGAVDYTDFLQKQILARSVFKASGSMQMVRDYFGSQREVPFSSSNIEALRSVSPAIKRLWGEDAYVASQTDWWFTGPSRQLKREVTRRALQQFGLDI